MPRSPQTLSLIDRRLAAAWAADCAERVAGIFEGEAPGDDRLRSLIARARAFSHGELDAAEAIRQRFAGGLSATEEFSPAAAMAARAAGQSAAVCHMGAHALGAAACAVQAVDLATPDRPEVADDEIRWQLTHMSPDVRTALVRLPPAGTNAAGPLGPGLLTNGRTGEFIERLQEGLAAG